MFWQIEYDLGLAKPSVKCQILSVWLKTDDIQTRVLLLSRRATKISLPHLTAHHLRMIDACLRIYSNEDTHAHTHLSFDPCRKVRPKPDLSLPPRHSRGPRRQRVQPRFVTVCPDLTCQLTCADVNADGCFQNCSSVSIKSWNVSLPLQSPSSELLKSVDSCRGWSAVLPNRIRGVLIWQEAFRTLAAQRGTVCVQSIACRLQFYALAGSKTF